MSRYAEIVPLEYFAKNRDRLGRIVCTSGGFDPLHPGHASCIVESKEYGDTLVVVVNGDGFLRDKKGKAFMALASRCKLIASLRGVDFVVPYEIEGNSTVIPALRAIRPDVFTKGGDRSDPSTIPEWTVCQELSIEVVTQVGDPKEWSSSELLMEWSASSEKE